MVTLSRTDPAVPASLNRFFEALSSVQTPALIWYSDNGERIELSGRVLMNWVNKTANLLIEECDLATKRPSICRRPCTGVLWWSA